MCWVTKSHLANLRTCSDSLLFTSSGPVSSFQFNYSWLLNCVGLNGKGQLKNPRISRPALFKPTLSKGQLYSDVSCIQAFRSLFGSLLILASSFCELFPLFTWGSLSPEIAATSFFFSVYTCCSPSESWSLFLCALEFGWPVTNFTNRLWWKWYCANSGPFL